MTDTHTKHALTHKDTKTKQNKQATHKQTNMVLNVHRNHKAYWGLGEGGEGGMEVGKEGRLLYTYRYTIITRMTPALRWGSSESHFNVSINVRDKVIRQCPQTTTSEEKREPKRIRTEAPPLTSLTTYR